MPKKKNFCIKHTLHRIAYWICYRITDRWYWPCRSTSNVLLTQCLANKGIPQRMQRSSNLRTNIRICSMTQHFTILFLLSKVKPSKFTKTFLLVRASLCEQCLHLYWQNPYREHALWAMLSPIYLCKENIHFRLNDRNALEIYELAALYDMKDVKIDAWNIFKWWVAWKELLNEFLFLFFFCFLCSLQMFQKFLSIGKWATSA